MMRNTFVSRASALAALLTATALGGCFESMRESSVKDTAIAQPRRSFSKVKPTRTSQARQVASAEHAAAQPRPRRTVEPAPQAPQPVAAPAVIPPRAAPAPSQPVSPPPAPATIQPPASPPTTPPATAPRAVTPPPAAAPVAPPAPPAPPAQPIPQQLPAMPDLPRRATAPTTSPPPAATLPSAPVAAPASAAVVHQPVMTSPQAAKQQAGTPDQQETPAQLVRRGRDLFYRGQVVKAREQLLSIIKIASPDALLELARTFDPHYLSLPASVDAKPDVLRAKVFYEEAERQGASLAASDLERLRRYMNNNTGAAPPIGVR